MSKLPKAIIKKYGISKKAWAVFRGRGRSKKNKSVKNMAKRRKSYRSRARSYVKNRFKSKRIGIISTGVAVYKFLLEPLFGNGADIGGAINAFKSLGAQRGVQEFVDVCSINAIGYKPSDGTWFGYEKPVTTWGAMLGAKVAGKVANMTGVNSSIAKIPLIGKYIKIG